MSYYVAARGSHLRRRVLARFAAVGAATALSVSLGSAATTSAEASAESDGLRLFTNTNTTTDPINLSAIVAKNDPSAINQFVASQPQAVWLTPDFPTSRVASVVRSYVSAAAQKNEVPVVALYSVPGRDCGLYSAGGFNTSAEYHDWIDQVVSGLGQTLTAVIVEPDALMLPPVTRGANHYGYCQLSDDKIQQRYDDIAYAVDQLSRTPNTATYIDAGHSHWWWGQVPGASDLNDLRLQEVAYRLRRVGVDKVRGFSLNVSSFYTTADQEAYGEKLSELLGGKHYVVDTSRNGNGPTDDQQWCNPAGRALGHPPTTKTDAPHNDADLWIKHPGESDGTCGVSSQVSGHWDQEYVNGLTKRAFAKVTVGTNR